LARSQVHVNDAPHFYRVAARIMRNLLVDYARERRRLKREAPTASDMIAASSETDSLHEPLPIMDVLDIDAALDKLGRKAPRAAEILELRYFAGLDDVEISAMCGVSRRTVEREGRFAKAFLAAYGKAKPLEQRSAGSAERRRCERRTWTDRGRAASSKSMRGAAAPEPIRRRRVSAYRSLHQPSEQLHGIHVQRTRQLDEVDDIDAPFASFDLACVRVRPLQHL